MAEQGEGKPPLKPSVRSPHFDLITGLTVGVGVTWSCNDVWFGHGATAIPSVRIGHGAILAAGAVVTGDVPDDQEIGR